MARDWAVAVRVVARRRGRATRATSGRARTSSPGGGGDDDGQHGPEPRPHAPPERDEVALGPAGGELGGRGAHDRHGHDAVGQLEEDVGVGVRAHRPRADLLGQGQDHQQGDLVGHDEPEGPPRQPEDGAHRLVAEVRPPAQPQPGPAQARDHEAGLGHHAGRGAQAEEQDLAPVRGHAGQRGVAHGGAEDEQHGDEHDVVGDGGEHGRAELAPGVEQGRAHADEPVTGELGHEEEQQVLRHAPGSGPPAALWLSDVVASMMNGTASRNSERGRRDHDHGHAHHGRDRVPGLVVGAGGEPVHEHRHERGRQHPAQHDVVDDVGHRVGEVVGVGQAQRPQRVGQGEDAQHPGDARQRRPHGHDRGGPAQPGPPRRSPTRVGGHLGAAGSGLAGSAPELVLAPPSPSLPSASDRSSGAPRRLRHPVSSDRCRRPNPVSSGRSVVVGVDVGVVGAGVVGTGVELRRPSLAGSVAGGDRRGRAARPGRSRRRPRWRASGCGRPAGSCRATRCVPTTPTGRAPPRPTRRWPRPRSTASAP